MAVLAVHDGPQIDLYVKLYPLHDLFRQRPSQGKRCMPRHYHVMLRKPLIGMLLQLNRLVAVPQFSFTSRSSCTAAGCQHHSLVSSHDADLLLNLKHNDQYVRLFAFIAATVTLQP